MKSLLIATGPLNYGTRRLRAGDEFEAPFNDGRVLVTVGLARDAVVRNRIADMGIDEWRDQYFKIHGYRADKRWGIARIRQEIEKIPGDTV